MNAFKKVAIEQALKDLAYSCLWKIAEAEKEYQGHDEGGPYWEATIKVTLQKTDVDAIKWYSKGQKGKFKQPEKL